MKSIDVEIMCLQVQADYLLAMGMCEQARETRNKIEALNAERIANGEVEQC